MAISLSFRRNGVLDANALSASIARRDSGSPARRDCGDAMMALFRRRITAAPLRPVLAALLSALAMPAGHAKNFDWTFELPGGSAAQRFDCCGPLFDYFFSPVAANTDLWGEVRIDTLSIIAPGHALSPNGGFFDTDVVFIPPFLPNALPGQRINRVSIDALPQSGARWSYVIRSENGGDQPFDANWDFRSESGSASPLLHLVKFSDPGPLTTFSNGLRAQLRVWSAAAPTSIAIDKLKVTVTGTIVRYQILPAANSGLIDIEPGDDARNEIEVSNSGTLRVRDTFTNRSSATLFNSGTIEILETADRTEVVNAGSMQNLASGSIMNSGRFANESGARLLNLGSFENHASFPGAPSPLGPDFPSARDPGFFNDGILDLDGGGFVNAGGRFFNRMTVNIGPDGLLRNEGSFANGSQTATGASIDSRGRLEHWSGSFVNYASIRSGGSLRNLGEMDNLGRLVVDADHGDAKLSNEGILRNGKNPALTAAEHEASGTLQIHGLLANPGEIVNRSRLAVHGELNNSGVLKNQGAFPGDPGVNLQVTGLLHNSGQLDSSGQIAIDGGRLENTSTVANGGSLTVGGGGILTGGTVLNQGQVQVLADGVMTDLALYRQTGAGALTQADGRLQALRVEILEGRLQGSGRVEAEELVVAPAAVLAPGNSPGLLTIAGTLLLDGTLELEISPTARDRLVVEGGLMFGAGAVVKYAFVDGAAPAVAERFAFDGFVGASGLAGEFGTLSFVVTGLPAGSQVVWNGADFTVTAVPEPGTWLTLATGLGLLGAVAARRRRSRPAGTIAA